MITLKPLGDRITVLVDMPEEEKTEEGLVIPAGVKLKENFIRATVLEIGPKVKTLKKDDRIAVNHLAMYLLPADRIALLHEDEIGCKIEESRIEVAQ